MVPVIKMKKRPSNVHQYKFLIVNDEPDITLTLKNGPEENGFSVDAFNDPNAALSARQHTTPPYYARVVSYMIGDQPTLDTFRIALY
ncbi:MAG: hypothetical protein WBE68_14030 [Candidatus Nitrosopolaris sp.]